ncbi:MAG: hypothetical protein JO001_20215 [Alphaproteobacteria bacterium]|nr:hypothetical protein [Alphaproteobacteria bacterium]
MAIAFDDEVRHVLDEIVTSMDVIAARIREADGKFDVYAWAKRVPVAYEITFIGPDGQLKSTTLASDPTAIDLSDRDQYRMHLDPQFSGQTYIGHPIVGRVSHRQLIPVSRRIDGADGKFLGVLVFLIQPGSLTALHRHMDLSTRTVIVLTGLDDVVRARFAPDSPDGTTGIGLSLAGDPRPSTMKALEGFYTRQGRVDGIPRIFAYRRVSGYPLVVTVGVDLDYALGQANKHAGQMVSQAALATIILIALMAYLVREIGLRTAHQIALAESEARLQVANSELRISRDRAEAASEAKSMFLANMSHELRTPLNAIIGFAQVLASEMYGPASDPRYREYAQYIETSGTHLMAIIGSILDIAKIESGSMELKINIVALSKIMETAVLAIRSAVLENHIKLEINGPVPLPSVKADPEKLLQILINLLSNSVKFTPADGSIVVDIRTDTNGLVIISVIDTGIGMKPAEISIALQPFAQIENTFTKTKSGTGLGLPIANKLAELHGSALSIESVPAVGTTVRFHLPVVEQNNSFGAISAYSNSPNDPGSSPSNSATPRCMRNGLMTSDVDSKTRNTRITCRTCGFVIETTGTGLDRRLHGNAQDMSSTCPRRFGRAPSEAEPFDCPDLIEAVELSERDGPWADVLLHTVTVRGNRERDPSAKHNTRCH